MQKDAESDISVTGTSEEWGCAQAFAGPGRPLSPGRNCHPSAKSRTLRTWTSIIDPYRSHTVPRYISHEYHELWLDMVGICWWDPVVLCKTLCSVHGSSSNGCPGRSVIQVPPSTLTSTTAGARSVMGSVLHLVPKRSFKIQGTWFCHVLPQFHTIPLKILKTYLKRMKWCEVDWNGRCPLFHSHKHISEATTRVYSGARSRKNVDPVVFRRSRFVFNNTELLRSLRLSKQL